MTKRQKRSDSLIYISYENAKIFLKKFNFLSSYEYNNYRKSNGRFDINIPYHPKEYYTKILLLFILIKL